MYAIISDGGRQIRVEEGQELLVDLRQAKEGDEHRFERVLAVGGGDGGFKFGAPLLDGAVVTAEILGVQQGEKIYIQKFRRRKTYRRRTGHRQLYTRVKINKIQL